MKISNFQKLNERGYIALTTVLVVMVVVIATVTTATYLSIGEAQSGLALLKGEDNLSFVEGCVEDVMLKIRSNSLYNAATISRPEGTCTITYNSGGPTNWDLLVSSQTTNYKRSINVVFVKNPTGITLTSWREN